MRMIDPMNAIVPFKFLCFFKASQKKTFFSSFQFTTQMAEETYGAIQFGEFRKYMNNKQSKLKNQQKEL